MIKYNIAAIGTDGNERVVWGLGFDADEAKRDAKCNADDSDCDAGLCGYLPVTPEQVEQIKSGVVLIEALGLKYEVFNGTVVPKA